MPKDGEGRLVKWQLANTIKYKTAYSVRIGPFTPLVSLTHPKNVKKLLKTTEPKQLADKAGYALLLEWLGTLPWLPKVVMIINIHLELQTVALNI